MALSQKKERAPTSSLMESHFENVSSDSVHVTISSLGMEPGPISDDDPLDLVSQF